MPSGCCWPWACEPCCPSACAACADPCCTSAIATWCSSACAAGCPSACASCCLSACATIDLPEIENREDEYPDQIDEVPVQTHDFDNLVVALSAGQQARPLLIQVSPPYLPRNDAEEDDADRYVGPVEAGDHEKRRAELRRSPGVAPRTYALEDQLRPFEGLHADERRAQGRGREQQDDRLGAILSIPEVHGEGHRSAAADQDERHDCDQQQWNACAEDRQREDLARVGPGHGRRTSHRHVRDEEAAEDEGIADEENPHHRLAPWDV